MSLIGRRAGRVAVVGRVSCQRCVFGGFFGGYRSGVAPAVDRHLLDVLALSRRYGLWVAVFTGSGVTVVKVGLHSGSSHCYVMAFVAEW